MPNLVEWLLDNEPEFRKSRLPSLYSDLKQQKASNPDGFAVNATAWQAALTRASLAGQLPTEQKIILRSSAELLEALRSAQWGQPTGLGVVLDEAVRNGKLIALDDFVTAEHSIYQKSWLPSPQSVLRWSLRQIGIISNGSYDAGGNLRQGRLVLIEGLERIAKNIQTRQLSSAQGLTDRVMSREAFAQQVAESEMGPLSEQEIEMLLRFLGRDKRLVSFDAHTVKFKAPSSEQPDSITQEDASIASIKALIASLESQISVLTARVATLQTTAQYAVQFQNRHAALSALRAKKNAERSLQQRTDTLHQLEEVYGKIEQAVDQVQMMQVMQSSAETLKSLNKRVGGVDKVDAVMDDLREQMGQVEDVGQIIEEPLDGKAVIDEAEVDDELAAMENEELARKEEIKAEATRLKLSELEDAEKAAKERGDTTSAKQAQDAELEAELSSSSQKLRQIRLDEDETVDPLSQQREEKVAAG